MNNVLETLITRRSCRNYKSEMIKEEELNEILKAGTYAANGSGNQSAIMIAITDKETRDKFSALNAKIMGKEGSDPYYGAPVVIAVLADKKFSTYKEDGSLVIGNLLNAAAALGLGSCWIHRAKEEFETSEGKDLLSSLGIKGDYEGIGHCILGYAAEESPAAEPRKSDYIYRVK